MSQDFVSVASAKDFNETPMKVVEVNGKEVLIATLVNEHVYSKITVSPEEMLRHYQLHRDQFRRPHSATIVHVFLSPSRFESPEKARAAARELYARIRDGADITEIARRHSHGLRAAKGGIWENLKPGTFRKEVDLFAFSLAEGELSPVIETAIPGPNGEKYCWYQCTVKGGREGRDMDAVTLATVCEKLGAGEILLNCIDRDGTNAGFDLELIRSVKAAVSIPVIASSGAGCEAHFYEVFKETDAESALAAGIFHRREVPIARVKDALDGRVEIRRHVTG